MLTSSRHSDIVCVARLDALRALKISRLNYNLWSYAKNDTKANGKSAPREFSDLPSITLSRCGKIEEDYLQLITYFPKDDLDTYKAGGYPCLQSHVEYPHFSNTAIQALIGPIR